MFVAGIDGHATYSVVAIVSNAGELVQKPVRIPNKESDRIVRLLEKHLPVEVVVETCPAWPWLFDLLQLSGIHFVLAHAKRLRAIADSTYKRDEVDAELLARMRLAGRIHAQLHSVGLHMARGHLLTRDGRRWVRSQAWPVLGPEQRLFIRMQWSLIGHLTPMIRALDKRVERMGREIPAVALLQTIPGIGPYRSLLIATETLPIERFLKPAHLVSYAGLAPRSSKSGLAPIRHGSIPAGANRWLRGAFVRAIVSHVAHAPDSWLSHSYEQIRQRLGWRVARVATARRLARAVHAMLRTGEAWQDQPTYCEKGELHVPHVAPTTQRV